MDRPPCDRIGVPGMLLDNGLQGPDREAACRVSYEISNSVPSCGNCSSLAEVPLACLPCQRIVHLLSSTVLLLLCRAQGASQEDMQRQILQEAGRAFPALIMSVVVRRLHALP